MKKKIVLFITLVCAFFAAPALSHASEFNFSVEPVIPENQINKDVSYFDLQMEKNQQQQVVVNLRNDTENEVKVNVGLSNATTNLNGVVEYSPNKLENSKSLPFKITDVVKAPESITIPANSSQELKLDITMPQEEFSGVVAGGITFKQDTTDETEDTSSQEGVSIKNEYSYVVALLLKERQDIIEPNLTLDEVKPSQINYRNVIDSTLTNDTTTYINQVAIEGIITKKGSTESVYSVDKNSMQIAPNSIFNFPVYLEGKKLEAGDYHIKLTVFGDKADDGTFVKKIDDQDTKFKHQWILEKDFTIAADEAKTLNEKDVTIKEEGPNWLLIVLVILVILLLLLVIILLLKRKKDDKEEKEQDKL